MKVFKLRPEEDDCIALTDINYRRATSSDAPWVVSKNGKPAHYAVCPECSNPIIVIGLDADNRQDKNGKPLSLHARHCAGDVAPVVAHYHQDAYDNCPLANPKAFTGDPIKREPGAFSREILELLQNEADTVKSFMESSLGIILTDEVFQQIIEKFVAQEGYLYRSIGKLNLPYAVLFMAKNQTVAPKKKACKLRSKGENSPFKQAVLRSKYFEIDQSYHFIKAKKDAPRGVRLNFFFDKHIIPASEDRPQVLGLVIEEECNGNKEFLIQCNVEFDLYYFYNTITKKRRERKIAATILEKLLMAR